MSSWCDIPELALTEIYACLTLKDKLNASSTCRYWRDSLFKYNQLSLGSLRLALGDEARRFDPHTKLTKSKTTNIPTPTHDRYLRKRKSNDDNRSTTVSVIKKCQTVDDIRAYKSGIISKFVKYYKHVDIIFECGLTIISPKSQKIVTSGESITVSDSNDAIAVGSKNSTYEIVSSALLSVLNDLVKYPTVEILSLKPYFRCECNYCQYVKNKNKTDSNNLNTWRRIQRRGTLIQSLEKTSLFDNVKLSNVICKTVLQTSCLERFSLGFVPVQVIDPYNIFQRMSKVFNRQRSNHHLHEINIAVIPPSIGIDLTCLQRLSLKSFSHLTELSSLTVNIESISEPLVQDLINGAVPNLQTLNLFLTNYGPRFDFPSDEMWQNLRHRRENFGVNVIFAEVFYARAVRNEESILKPHLPLKGLYYIYQDHHPWHILHAIDSWYCTTLEVISIHYVQGDANFHPLSPFDWLVRVKKCTNLKTFAVSGLDFRDYELVHTVYDAKKLQNFYISSCEVTTDSEESPEGIMLSTSALRRFEGMISKFMNKPWKTSPQQPLQKRLLRKKQNSNHNVIHYLVQEYCQFC